MKKVELIASKCYHPSGIITITLVFQVRLQSTPSSVIIPIASRLLSSRLITKICCLSHLYYVYLFLRSIFILYRHRKLSMLPSRRVGKKTHSLIRSFLTCLQRVGATSCTPTPRGSTDGSICEKSLFGRPWLPWKKSSRTAQPSWEKPNAKYVPSPCRHLSSLCVCLCVMIYCSLLSFSLGLIDDSC